MAIVADVDVFIMGSGGAGLAAGARLKSLGASVAIADEAQWPGGLLTGGLGLPDYVGVGASTDTLSGFGRKFFLDCEVAAIADGAVVGSPADNSTTPPTPEVRGYGRQYADLPRRYLPEWGRYARDKMLAGLQTFWDIEIVDFQIDQFTKLGGVVTFADGRQVKAKQFLSCSYEAQLGRAAKVPYTYGRSENRATFDELLAGAYSNNRNTLPAALLNAKGDIIKGNQGYTTVAEGFGDLRVMAYNWRSTFSQHPNRLPFQAPMRPDGLPFREADFEDWINERGSKYTNIEQISSGQFVDQYCMTTNGGSQWGSPMEYVRCKTKAQRRLFWAWHYYYTAGWYYLAQNSPRVNPALRANMALWGLPPNHNVTEWFGQRGWSSHLYVRASHRMRSSGLISFENIGRSARGTVLEAMGRGGYHADSHAKCHSTIPGGGYTQDGDMIDDVQDGRSYWNLPFAALKPPSAIIRNMLEVGCPAVSDIVICSLRMEPTWMSIGEAAGVAAFVAVRDGIPVSEVPYSKIRELTDSLGMKV
ncbi:FAD-dependent oxidoreductase [Methylobacterium sp. E-045]|uniref:FAD-dependent oxidoreductase n=1 Tax=Methylobacterium sp. E-045 TaxID=2836575 RepID=UPI001FBAEC90|nr:FAD-dependent oxidoreductase [Methylobacterium sp. E-045]MCJ2129211.1 FAD-dependent oxidoreductase [Methylobacterium sp. E-045]